MPAQIMTAPLGGSTQAAPTPAAPQPATQSTAPAAAPQTGGSSDKPQQSPLENKFFALQRQVEKGLAEIQRLREENARLSGRVEAVQPKTPAAHPTTWADVSTENLDEAIRTGMKDGNPDFVVAAVNEKIRRGGESNAKQAIQAADQRNDSLRYRDEVRAAIARDFGKEALDENSELFRRADAYYTAFANRLGRETVEADPDKIYDAVSRAHRDLHATNDANRIQELERELERAKRLQQLAVGGAGRAPVSQESAERLKAGDVRGALKASPVFSSIGDDIRRRAGVQ